MNENIDENEDEDEDENVDEYEKVDIDGDEEVGKKEQEQEQMVLKQSLENGAVDVLQMKDVGVDVELIRGRKSKYPQIHEGCTAAVSEPKVSMNRL